MKVAPDRARAGQACGGKSSARRPGGRGRRILSEPLDKAALVGRERTTETPVLIGDEKEPVLALINHGYMSTIRGGT